MMPPKDVTVVAPSTVKKSFGTPVSVNPGNAVNVIVAVYAVAFPNVEWFGDHVTVPVYCAEAVIVVTGVAPAAGSVTPKIAAMLMGWSAVFGNSAVITPPTDDTAVAPATVKKSAGTPSSVYPDNAVNVMVAVYTVA